MDYDHDLLPYKREKERQDAHQCWRLVLGKKIICSSCEAKTSTDFTFRWNVEQNRKVIITCKICDHSGNYHAGEETMALFKKALNIRVRMTKKKEGNYALEA